MRRVNNDVYQRALKVAKRITITILCCVPVLMIFAYLMRHIITSDAVQIICFMLIMGVTVLVEEIIARRVIAKREADKLLNNKKDVFK